MPVTAGDDDDRRFLDWRVREVASDCFRDIRKLVNRMVVLPKMAPDLS